MCIHKPRVHIGVVDNTGRFDVKFARWKLMTVWNRHGRNDRDCLRLKQKTFVLLLNEIMEHSLNKSSRDKTLRLRDIKSNLQVLL